MNNKHNILFLDIGGVLNSHGGTCDGAFTLPYCVSLLNLITDATNAKIVVCSARRYLVHNGYMTATGLALLLQSHGVTGEVIDVTRPSRDEEYIDGEPRWRQIADWIKRPLLSINRYAIIDDDPGAFGGRPGVQTNGRAGLTESDANAVIEILNDRTLAA